jgi:glyoxylase-like metal-dependent hydrolase (beta-lactamase superfamily II)
MVSTPLEDRTTLSNGGIIAGTQGVVVVEGFGSVEGAQWMATKALEVTGMRPTHVVLTHYHADHSNGLAGYLNDGQSPEVIHTSKTEELLQASLRDRDLGGAQSPLSTLSPEGLLPDGAGGMVLDLGNREIRIRSLAGHTPSDLTVQVEDPRVVFCGDLVWNGMFPNYVDALPSRLWASCNELLRDDGAVYVPGHGSAARYGEIRSFLNVIEHVGEAAQRAFESGKTAAEGAADYSLPENLGEWFMFSPRYYEVAFGAWYRELRG